MTNRYDEGLSCFLLDLRIWWRII